MLATVGVPARRPSLSVYAPLRELYCPVRIDARLGTQIEFVTKQCVSLAPLRGQTVEVGRLKHRGEVGAVRAHRVDCVVVGHDKHDVRPFRRK